MLTLLFVSVSSTFRKVQRLQPLIASVCSTVQMIRESDEGSIEPAFAGAERRLNCAIFSATWKSSFQKCRVFKRETKNTAVCSICSKFWIRL